MKSGLMYHPRYRGSIVHRLECSLPGSAKGCIRSTKKATGCVGAAERPRAAAGCAFHVHVDICLFATFSTWQSPMIRGGQAVCGQGSAGRRQDCSMRELITVALLLVASVERCAATDCLPNFSRCWRCGSDVLAVSAWWSVT